MRISLLFLFVLASCAEPPPSPPANNSPIIWKRPKPPTPANDPNLDLRINPEDGSPVCYDRRLGTPTPTPHQVRPAGDHRDSPFGSH